MTKLKDAQKRAFLVTVLFVFGQLFPPGFLLPTAHASPLELVESELTAPTQPTQSVTDDSQKTTSSEETSSEESPLSPPTEAEEITEEAAPQAPEPYRWLSIEELISGEPRPAAIRDILIYDYDGDGEPDEGTIVSIETDPETRKVTYKFDGDGDGTIDLMMQFLDGKKTLQEESDNGKLSKRIVYNDNGSRDEFFFDETGTGVKSITSYDPAGVKIMETVFSDATHATVTHFLPDGRPSRVEEREDDGIEWIRISTLEYFYDPGIKYIKKLTTYNPDGTVKQTIYYDAEGNPVDTTPVNV